MVIEILLDFSRDFISFLDCVKREAVLEQWQANFNRTPKADKPQTHD